jgi:uncharacterized protein (TIGR02099 family)
MWNSRPVRLLWHSFNWLTRAVILAIASVLLVFALLIVLLRYWLLPNIEQYHQPITAALSEVLGRPTTIATIAGDWQGLRPRLSLANLTILDDQKNPALVLPSVRVSLSWWSVVTAELRVSSLEIERPELMIRRDVSGKVFLGGIAIEAQTGATHSANNNLLDTLLHQSRMVARDALIVWVDEQRAAPPLVLEKVNVRIENSFSHHRFAVRAVASEELASPVDIRGDFQGKSFADLPAWHGQVFAQLPHTDIAAWRAWLDLPKELSRGRGGLRAWLTINAGKFSKLQVDLAVRDVATQLADDVPEMALRSLNGRATWSSLPAGFELETKRLTMQLQNGVTLPTTDLYVRSLDAHNKQPASGEIRANELQLETLVNLSNFVPISDELRAQLVEFAPHGKVSNLKTQWQGTPKKLSGFSIQGKFENIGLRQVGEFPGFSGLTADVEGDQNSGKLHINSTQLNVDAPGILRDPVGFHSLNATASWQHLEHELSVKVDDLLVDNADIAGKAYGSFRTDKDSSGVLDLTVDLTRADLRQASRYIPLTAMNRKVNDWLHDAVLAGNSDAFHLRILGNLDHFPFDKKGNGEFELSVQMQGAGAQFAKEWPIVENANGKLLMTGKKLALSLRRASSAGLPLRDISVQVPDITIAKPMLETKLQASAATRDFLQYIQRSPVRAYVNGFTDTVRTKGDGALELSLRIPQLGENLVEVQGVYRIRNNEVDLGGNIPIMRNVNGELHFTEKGLETKQLVAQIIGGPAEIEVKTTPTGVLANLNGTSDFDVFSQTNPHPLFQYVHGGAAWNAQIDVVKQLLHVQVHSNLQGVSSVLPAPFSKAQNAALPLSFDLRSGETAPAKSDGLSKVDVELDKLFSARLLLQNQPSPRPVKRAVINFAGQGKWLEQDGIWLVGDVPELSVQGWEKWFGAANQASSDDSMSMDGADLHIAKLSGYGRTIDNVHVLASKRGEGLAAKLDSQVVNGELVWQPHGYQNGGKLVAHLSDFSWPAEELSNVPSSQSLPANAGLPETPNTFQPGKIPMLEVTINKMQVAGKKIGSLELIGHPDGDSWRLRRLIVTNPDGGLSGDGAWLGGAGNPQTKINLALEISNAGNILDRSGAPNTVKEGSGKLLANLAWLGSPDEFNLKNLAGTLKLDTGKGQFLKLDPNVSKLAGVLSVLSLQALPKRIALDFTDVFSGGFQFDNINGNALIQNGNMAIQDFRIDGSAAKILMKGNVNLVQETQDLRVNILPSIGSGVSLIGAFAINPVFGVSAFVVDKLLGNPLDKLVSFEYNVSGTWADPSVVKVGQKPVPAPTRLITDLPLDVIEPNKIPLPPIPLPDKLHQLNTP